MAEWVYVGVGATMASSVGAVFGSTVGYVDRLGKSVDELKGRAAIVARARGLEDRLTRAGEAARAADARVERLSDELARARRPTKAMRDALAGAREIGAPRWWR